jgi:hypothetical protein
VAAVAIAHFGVIDMVVLHMVLVHVKDEEGYVDVS